MAATQGDYFVGEGGAQQAREQEIMNEKAAAERTNGIPQQKQQPATRPGTGSSSSSSNSSSDGPAGGWDGTPIPQPPQGTIGYTLKFTFHRATNLIMGDAHAFSSDPYVLAQLNTGLPQRHKEDPKLRFRTPTVRKNVDP